MSNEDELAKEELITFCNRFLQVIDREELKTKIDALDLIVLKESLSAGLEFCEKNP